MTVTRRSLLGHMAKLGGAGASGSRVSRVAASVARRVRMRERIRKDGGERW